MVAALFRLSASMAAPHFHGHGDTPVHRPAGSHMRRAGERAGIRDGAPGETAFSPDIRWQR